jgi:hypothetical protein
MKTLLTALALAALMPVASMAQSDNTSNNQPATAVGSGTAKALQRPATTQPTAKEIAPPANPQHRQTRVAANRHKASKSAQAKPGNTPDDSGG